MLSKADYHRMEDVFDKTVMLTPAYEKAGIDEQYKKSSGNPIFYGLPHTKQYPMPDEAHVRSAVRFFNYVSSDDEEELAANIIKMIKKYNITDLNVGPKNRFGKYYSSKESFMTQTSPIVPYQGEVLKKPAMEYAKSSQNKLQVTSHTLSYTKLHVVYFALSYHSTFFGNFVKFMTNAPYSHCSIFFDSKLQEGYSFGGREGHTLVPYGLCNESMDKWAIHNPEARYALYAVFVDNRDFTLIYSKVKEMYKRRTDFRYDVPGVVKTFFGIHNANDVRYFCSGFVSLILNQGKTKHNKKSYDLNKPMDMTETYDAHLVDMGIAKNYSYEYVDKEVHRIYQKYYSKSEKKQIQID